jgi:lysophospholipase L1-like esterase
MLTHRPIRRRVLAALLLLVSAFALAACGGGSSSGDASRGPIVYAAIGASDAVGVGAVPLRNGYVPLLADRLRAAGFDTTLHNLGINGAHVGDMIDDELPDALASAPDVVTIWTGANDLIGGDDPDAFAAELAFLLAQLQDGTDAAIYVGDLPDLTLAPLFRDGSDPDVTKARVDAYNQRIHQAVADAGCVLVLLSTVELTDDLTWIDGFHPSNEGHAVLADVYWSEIASDL